MRFLFLSVLMAVLSACATGIEDFSEYEGSDAASIKDRKYGNTFGSFRIFALISIDDQATSDGLGFDNRKVMPGKRNLVVRASSRDGAFKPSYIAYVPLLVDLPANGQFQLAGEISDMAAKVWLEDLQTGEAFGPVATAPLQPMNSGTATPVFIPTS